MQRGFLTMILLVAFLSTAHAQLTGSKTIPGDYATIAAAITALNSSGVGAGGVTFNVAAGHTEPAINLTITTTTAGAATPVIFQKSGSGANPLITATTGGTGNYDGVIRIEGTDHVTFDGIDITANQTAGLTNAQRAECAYGAFAASATNGTQNLTIRNCVITGFDGYVNTTANIVTAGILLDHTRTAAGTAVTPTSAAGVNANADIFNNTVANWYNGI